MADPQMEEKKARKREERTMDRYYSRCAEMDWEPNKDKSDHEGVDPGHYFANRLWDNDEISKCLRS